MYAWRQHDPWFAEVSLESLNQRTLFSWRKSKGSTPRTDGDREGVGQKQRVLGPVSSHTAEGEQQRGHLARQERVGERRKEKVPAVEGRQRALRNCWRQGWGWCGGCWGSGRAIHLSNGRHTDPMSQARQH